MDGMESQQILDDDPIFNIITSTVLFGQTWTKQGLDMFCTDCQIMDQQKNYQNTYVFICNIQFDITCLFLINILII